MNHKKRFILVFVVVVAVDACLREYFVSRVSPYLTAASFFFFFFSFCFKNLLTIKFKLVLFPFDGGGGLFFIWFHRFLFFYLLQPKRKLNQLLFPIPINIQQLLFKTIINKIKLIRLQLKYLNLLLTPLTKG